MINRKDASLSYELRGSGQLLVAHSSQLIKNYHEDTIDSQCDFVFNIGK